MNAGFFGLVAYLVEHYRSKGSSMPAMHAGAPQDDGAAPHVTRFGQIERALEERLVELLPDQDGASGCATIQSANADSSGIDLTGSSGFFIAGRENQESKNKVMLIMRLDTRK